MKFKINFITIISVLVLSISGCENETDFVNENKSLNTNTQGIYLKESTQYTSPLLYRLGVKSIDVTVLDSDKFEYNFQTFKEFIIDGNFTNLSNFKVEYNKGVLSLNQNNTPTVLLRDNSVFIKTNNYEGDLKSYNRKWSKELKILLLSLNEITQLKKHKINATEAFNNELILNISKSEPCGFWDTYLAVGVGPSESVANENLGEDIRDNREFIGENNCEAFGDVDTSCLGDEHLCVSTLAFCCRG